MKNYITLLIEKLHKNKQQERTHNNIGSAESKNSKRQY